MSFENLLRSVSRLASERIPGKYFIIDCFLGDCLGVLSCQFWSTVLQCGSRMPIHTLTFWTVKSSSRRYKLSRFLKEKRCICSSAQVRIPILHFYFVNHFHYILLKIKICFFMSSKHVLKPFISLNFLMFHFLPLFV